MRRRDPLPVPPAAPALSPSLKVLLGLAASVIVLVGLHLGRELAGPLFVAAVIVIICHPVRHPLERRGWAPWAATTAVIGPLGAILSIPLTLLVRAVVLEGDPDARWLRWLSGDDAAAGPPPGRQEP